MDAFMIKKAAFIYHVPGVQPPPATEGLDIVKPNTNSCRLAEDRPFFPLPACLNFYSKPLMTS